MNFHLLGEEKIDEDDMEVIVEDQPYEINADLNPELKEIVEKGNHAFSISDWKSAFHYYSQVSNAAKNGHVFFRLGVMYHNGHFVKIDKNRAKWYFLLALEILPLQDNDPEAQTDLGYIYDHGYGVEPDKFKAVYYYKRAAAKGFARALCNLGYMYGYGFGVPKRDDKRAVKYYQIAVDKGNLTAIFNLGYMYDQGYGVAHDAKTAESLFNLGYMYEYGSGVKVDYPTAATYYQQSADRGYIRAQTDITRLYLIGNGVIKSLAMAIKYYYAALMQSPKEVDSGFKDLFNSEENRIESTQVLAQEWPAYHALVNDNCKKVIMEVFWIRPYICVDIPIEICFLIAKHLISVWVLREFHFM